MSVFLKTRREALGPLAHASLDRFGKQAAGGEEHQSRPQSGGGCFSTPC